MRFAALVPFAWLLACSFDWNAFDPRLAATTSSAGGAGTGGMAGGPATGGGVSSSSGQGGAGGMLPLGPWSPPQIVAPLSDPADDDDPSMTADGLELYFNSLRSSSKGEIWVSKRSRTSDPWGMPSSVDELNSVDRETNHTVSPDGHTMYLLSDRDAPGAPLVIYRASRPNRSSLWSTPMLDDELNQRNIAEVGGITENGLLLVGSACVNSVCDLVILERTSTSSPWGTPQPIAEINSAYEDGEAWLHPLGTAVFFESNRPGALGGWDLMFSLRASIDDSFDPPEFITELASMQSEGDANVSPDLRYMLFSRPGSNGEREIFESSR